MATSRSPQARMGIDSRMQALIESFPTLNPCPSIIFQGGFDSTAFGRWVVGRTGSAGQDAALFCLSVWNPHTNWDEHIPGLARPGNHGRFEFHRAFANWDHEHRAAFTAFCDNPWWP